MTLASAAFPEYRDLPRARRAAFLRQIAANLEGLGDPLIHRVMAESALPEGRVRGELGRTCSQLRFFAGIVDEGSWVDARIDTADPEQALALAMEHKPDAILLDLEMPEMSGLDMLKRLMLLGKAKVIVVSSVGQTGSPQALEARRLGAVDVIAKPSGAMSLDLQAKKGHEIVQSLRRALQLDAAPGA